MKNIFKLLLLFIFICNLFGVDDPDEPISPDKEENISNYEFNIFYKKQAGNLYKGVTKEKISNFYITGLKWKGNESGSQNLLIDLVKSINIVGYTMVKKTKDNLSVVYYLPYQFNIKMKNGKEIKNAKGRIKKLDKIEVYNEYGEATLYTYFIRYWLEDKGIFSDNKSSDYQEKPDIPNDVITYIEFK